MFDRTYIHRSEGPSHVTVEEKRAPTDDSVRLLREMEGKAREQVVEALRITSASVEAVVHRYDDPMDMKTHFKIHYKVNGQQRECTLWTDDRAEISEKLEAIWKKVAEDLAAFFVEGMARNVGKRLF